MTRQQTTKPTSADIARIKDELPVVPVVSATGRRYSGRISGRHLDYPIVWWRDINDTERSVETSWERIYRAVELGIPFREELL